MLLGLGGLFAGMGVLDLQDAAHLVVGIILHPAVGVAPLRDAGHAVVGVGGLADWGWGRSREAPPLLHGTRI